MNSFIFFLGVALFALSDAHPAVHRVTGEYVTHVHKFKEEDGHRVPEGSGIGLKTNCNTGAVVGTGRALEHGISGVINNAAGAVSDVTMHGHLLGIVGDAVDHVGHAAQGLVDDVDHGLGNGIADLGCGIGQIANEAASAIDTGDILGGIENVAKTAVTSVEHTVGNVLGGAAHGVENVLGQAVGLLEDL